MTKAESSNERPAKKSNLFKEVEIAGNDVESDTSITLRCHDNTCLRKPVLSDPKA